MKILDLIKRIIIVTIVILGLVLGAMAWSVRKSNVVGYNWKYKRGTYISDVITFGPYDYDYPVIKYNGKVVAIALFQFSGNLLLYYPECDELVSVHPI